MMWAGSLVESMLHGVLFCSLAALLAFKGLLHHYLPRYLDPVYAPTCMPIQHQLATCCVHGPPAGSVNSINLPLRRWLRNAPPRYNHN